MLAELNTALRRAVTEPAHRFCSIVVGVMTPTADGCDVLLAAGGHSPPVLLRADGSAAYAYVDGGQVVGLLPEPTFVPTTLHLGPGDTLLLYTDGLSEARVDRNTRYDESDLLEFLGGSAPMSAPGAVAAVRTLLGGFSGKLDDDTAVLAIGVPTSTS